MRGKKKVLSNFVSFASAESFRTGFQRHVVDKKNEKQSRNTMENDAEEGLLLGLCIFFNIFKNVQKTI